MDRKTGALTPDVKASETCSTLKDNIRRIMMSSCATLQFNSSTKYMDGMKHREHAVVISDIRNEIKQDKAKSSFEDQELRRTDLNLRGSSHDNIELFYGQDINERAYGSASLLNTNNGGMENFNVPAKRVSEGYGEENLFEADKNISMLTNPKKLPNASPGNGNLAKYNSFVTPWVRRKRKQRQSFYSSETDTISDELSPPPHARKLITRRVPDLAVSAEPMVFSNNKEKRIKENTAGQEALIYDNHQIPTCLKKNGSVNKIGRKVKSYMEISTEAVNKVHRKSCSCGQTHESIVCVHNKDLFTSPAASGNKQEGITPKKQLSNKLDDFDSEYRLHSKSRAKSENYLYSGSKLFKKACGRYVSQHISDFLHSTEKLRYHPISKNTKSKTEDNIEACELLGYSKKYESKSCHPGSFRCRKNSLDSEESCESWDEALDRKLRINHANRQQTTKTGHTIALAGSDTDLNDSMLSVNEPPWQIGMKSNSRAPNEENSLTLLHKEPYSSHSHRGGQQRTGSKTYWVTPTDKFEEDWISSSNCCYNNLENSNTQENKLNQVHTSKLNDKHKQKEVLALKRRVGPFTGITFIVGTIIGSGIFASPKSVIERSGSTASALFIWAACGILTLFASLSYVELGTTIQKSGAEYAYLLDAYGGMFSFLLIWVKVTVTRPSSLAAIALTCGQYIADPLLGDCGNHGIIIVSKIIGAFVIGIITFVNCASVKWATRMQVIFTAAKLLAIALLVITGLVRLGQGFDDNFSNAFTGTSKSISDIGYAFYGGLWAYDGWNNLNYVTEELKNPLRDLPLAIMIGIPLVTGCYVLVNIAYLTVLTKVEIATSGAVAVTLANRLYGVMAWIMPVFVACSTFGAANGSAFSGGRLVYVSAREGHMPKFLAMIHTKRHTPLPAMLFTSFIACIMLIPDSSNFETLINYFSFAAWTFYGATVSALLWLRIRDPNRERPYKVFIGIPVIVLLASIYLIIAPFYDYPLQSFFCLLFILLGVPVYFLFVKKKILPTSCMNWFDKVTQKLQVLCDVALPDSEEDMQ